MDKIIWTNNALSDLNDIADFIAKDSSKFAEITINKLYNKVKILSNGSKLGRMVPELEQEHLRELIEGNYRIIYELDKEKIYILTVHHSSRMLRL